jgi:hypothetical protein
MVSSQLHAPAALLPENDPLVLIGQEAGWDPEPVWTRWWSEKFPASTGTRTPDHPARSPALYHWAIPVRGLDVIAVRHQNALCWASSSVGSSVTCFIEICGLVSKMKHVDRRTWLIRYPLILFTSCRGFTRWRSSSFTWISFVRKLILISWRSIVILSSISFLFRVI